MTTKLVTAERATINTISVSIKTLTVGAKQVTLAMFRQIPIGPLITEDGRLDGTPWGVVRYETKDSQWLTHVVYVRDNTLMRCALPLDNDRDRRRFAWLDHPTLCANDGILPDDYAQQSASYVVVRDPSALYHVLNVTRGNYPVAFDGIDVNISCEFPTDIGRMRHCLPRRDKFAEWIVTPDQYDDRLRKSVAAFIASAKASFDERHFINTTRTEIQRRKSIMARLMELAQLDQFFIAV